jgi:hypothetical protein
MKAKFYQISIILCVCGLAFFTSCEDETTVPKPVDRFNDVTAFETLANCELSVVGVYSQAQSGMYPANNTSRGYPFGAASIQQSDMRGEDMMNVDAFFQITYESTYNASAGTANNDALWQNSWSVVAGANLVIEGVTKAIADGILSTEVGEAYIGEMRFLRALTYHNLLIHFARPFAEQGNKRYGLPYIDYPMNSQENIDKAGEQPRDNLDVCYTNMIADLDYAESKLGNTHAKNKITRATKGAAIALKTRILLHKGDWAGVKREAAKLVNATFTSPIGSYALTAEPSTPLVSYTSNSESIFSIENGTMRNSTVNGSLNQLLTMSNGGRALVAISPIAYNNPYWIANDKRRDMMERNTAGIYFTTKYANAVATMSGYAPIIRYAEVLLTYAEAIIRDGGTVAEALPYLNAVRNRSLQDAAADAYTASKFADNKEFMRALLNERRIEFLGEGRRWEDIHRLLLDPDYTTGGIPAKAHRITITDVLIPAGTPVYVIGGEVPAAALTTIPAIPYSDRRCVWPIPESTTTRNPTLHSQQNEGW